jgi:hypothetical protein
LLFASFSFDGIEPLWWPFLDLHEDLPLSPYPSPPFGERGEGEGEIKDKSKRNDYTSIGECPFINSICSSYPHRRVFRTH